MTKKSKLDPALATKKKRVRKGGGLQVDKAAVTAATLGTFLAAQQVQAEEKSNEARLAEELAHQAQAEGAETQESESLSADAQLLEDLAGANLDIPPLEGDIVASEVPVADLDGLMTADAAGFTEVAQGVDARTTMLDSGGSAGNSGTAGATGSGSAGSAAAGAEAGTASAAGSASAAGAAGSAAASSMAGVFGGMIGATGIPVGLAALTGVAIAGAVAGGGGSGITGGAATTGINGLVVDANVKGAKVYYDRNNNNVAEDDEYIATTRDDGTYSAEIPAGSTAKIIIKGGVDIITGQEIGTMITPAGYTNVSPLTTLLAASGQSEAVFLEKLGLTGIDLNTYDPLADMKGADPAKAALALKAFTISQQVYTVIQSAAELKAKSDGSDGSATVSVDDITAIARSIAISLTSTDATTSIADKIATATTAAVTAAITKTDGSAPSAEVQQLADLTKGSLQTVTKQIAQDYVGLDVVLKNQASTDPVVKAQANADLATKVSVAAVSQTELNKAISTNDTTKLAVLTDTQALTKLAKEVYQDAVQQNIQTGTPVTVKNLVITNVAGAAAALLPDNNEVVIRDTAANLATAPLATWAADAQYIAAVVTDTPTFTQFQALVGHEAVTFMTSSVTVLASQAAALAAAAADLQAESIFNVIAPTLDLTLSQAQALVNAGVMFRQEADVDGSTYTLSLTGTQVGTVAATSAGVKLFSDVGFTQIEATSAASINGDQLGNVASNGLKFVGAGIVTLQVTDGQLFGALAARVSQLNELGVDVIAATTSNGVLTFTGTQLATISAENLIFGDANVTVNVNSAAELHALAAVGNLSGMGVDAVVITPSLTALDGILGSATLAADLAAISPTITTIDVVGTDVVSINLANYNTLVAGGLQFAAGDLVRLTASPADAGTIAAAAATIAQKGIDAIALGSSATVLAPNATAIFNAGLRFADPVHATAATGSEFTSLVFAAGGGTLVSGMLSTKGVASVGFTPANEAVLQSMLSSSPVLAVIESERASVNFTTIDVGSNTAAITWNQYQALVNTQTQLRFAADDVITVNVGPTESTAAATAAAALAARGVDFVNPGAAVVFDTSTAAAFLDNGLKFTPASSVSITINSMADLSRLPPAASMLAAGVDNVAIKPASASDLESLLSSPDFVELVTALEDAGYTNIAIDAGTTPVTIDAADVAVLHEANISFAAGNNITLSISEAALLDLNAPMLASVGVDVIDFTDTFVHLPADLALDLMAANIVFADADTITVFASGLDDAVALAAQTGLATAGIDNVVFTLADDAAVDALVDSTDFATTLANLRNAGINVSLIDVAAGPISLTSDQALVLINGDVSFTGRHDVVLQVADGDLAATGSLGASIADLSGIGVSHIGAADGTLDLSPGVLQQLTNNGLDLVATDSVTVSVADASGLQLLDTLTTGGGLNVDDVLLTPLNDSALDALLDSSGFSSAVSNIQDRIPGFDTIDIAGPGASGTASVTDAQAQQLLSDGLHFAELDTINLDAGAAGTHLNTSLKDLQKLGVDAVALTGGVAGDMTINLGAGDALAGGLPQFAANANVDLQIEDGQLGEVLANAGALHTAGIDEIKAADGSLTVGSLADANTLLANDTAWNAATDLRFDAADSVTLTVTSGELGTIGSQLGALGDLNIDFLQAGSAHITTGLAASMVAEGIDFSATDIITLDVEGDAASTHLSTSLKDLQKLGVDAVTYAGDAIDVDLGGPLTAGVPLPRFGETDGVSGLSLAEDAALEVTLNIGDAAITPISGNVNAFAGAGVDVLNMIDNSATVTVGQVNNLLHNDGAFNANDLRFDVTDTVTLTDTAANLASFNVSAFDTVGVDFIDVTGNTITISDETARELATAGIDFVAGDTGVTMEVDGSAGTHLSTSLKELQKLGVDQVSLVGAADADGTLTVDMGNLTSFSGLPQFDQSDNITLRISDADGEAVLAHAAELKAAGIDTISVDGAADVILNTTDLLSLIGPDFQYNAGDLNISSENNTTLELSATDMGNIVRSLSDGQGLQGLQGAGIDHLSVGGPVGLSSEHAAILIDAGLDFVSTDDVTLTVDVSQGEATHLSTSLKDLQKLGVDHIGLTGLGSTDGAALTVDLGAGSLTGGLPVFSDELNVTLNVRHDQLNEISAADLAAANIDGIQLQGGLNDLAYGIDPAFVAEMQADGVQINGLTLEFAGDDASLDSMLSTLPAMMGDRLGDLAVTKVDHIGGQLNVDLQTAQTLVDAGISFESLDDISLDIHAGSSTGTTLATQFEEMHKLGVDNITVHLDGNSLDALSGFTFDQELDVTLNIGDQHLDVSELAQSLQDLGFDKLAFNEDLTSISSGLGSLLTELAPVTAVADLQLEVSGMSGGDLGQALGSGLGESANDYAAIAQALSEAGITDVVVETTQAVHIADGLAAALAEAGMLQALPEANIVLDVEAGAHHVQTTLKDMADLDVDQIVTNSDGNLYINLGELGQGDALAEITDLLGKLGDASLFNDAGLVPTLVMDNKTAEALSHSGVFDANVLSSLGDLGIKQIGVLVGNNEQSDIVAQVAVPVEVKLIGQAMDPALFDELHQKH